MAPSSQGYSDWYIPINGDATKGYLGDDADIFRPERWVKADAGTRAKYERTTDVIFGSGRFVCLGRNIAWMELNKAFVEVCAPDLPPYPS
jgi:cytochrome P450